jgi:hypothetical protein
MKWFIPFLLLPLVAQADVLVRSCPTAGTSCSATPTWQLPASAAAVQAQRTGAPFVPLAQVLPTERIAACYNDPTITAGSIGNCSTKVPGRTDLWQLKSVLYPPSAPTGPATITLTIDAANPHWDSGAALSTTQLTDLYVRLYGAPEGQALVLLDAVPWASTLTFKRTPSSSERQCFAASLALDTTGDKIPDRESAQTTPWCGTPASPPPVLILQPPNSITGTAP